MKNYFGKQIKKLGFGLMRLPMLNEKSDSEVDIEKVKKMVDVYMDHGFSYFDTAYVYHNEKSEEILGKAITERYPRDKFQAATKLPLWNLIELSEMKKMTQTSLNRMQLDYFDLYLLHGVGPERLEMYDKSGVWNYLTELRESGKAKNIGFSYHGDGDSLNRILDIHAKNLDLVQLQINYLDWEDKGIQSRKCYEAAVAHDIGIIVMEPVKGGSLSNFTPSVANVFKKANPNASLASWALRFAMGLDGVVTVLSGMSTQEQLEDNIAVAEKMEPLSDADMKVIMDAMEEIKKIPTIPCTACGYCVKDCPQKIDTAKIMNIMNDYLKYQNIAGTKRWYGFVTNPGADGKRMSAKSSECTECGSCESHCPQKLKIIDTHKEAAGIFE